MSLTMWLNSFDHIILHTSSLVNQDPIYLSWNIWYYFYNAIHMIPFPSTWTFCQVVSVWLYSMCLWSSAFMSLHPHGYFIVAVLYIMWLCSTSCGCALHVAVLYIMWLCSTSCGCALHVTVLHHVAMFYIMWLCSTSCGCVLHHVAMAMSLVLQEFIQLNSGVLFKHAKKCLSNSHKVCLEYLEHNKCVYWLVHISCN